MTTRYKPEEWVAIVAATERGLVVSDEPYMCPEVGSPAFAKTIDHTLLKLDSRAVQFDSLCAEARVDGFAVCSNDAVDHRGSSDCADTRSTECVREASFRASVLGRPEGYERQGRKCYRIPRRQLRSAPETAVRRAPYTFISRLIAS